MLWIYCHYKYSTLSHSYIVMAVSAGIDFRRLKSTPALKEANIEKNILGQEHISVNPQPAESFSSTTNQELRQQFAACSG